MKKKIWLGIAILLAVAAGSAVGLYTGKRKTVKSETAYVAMGTYVTQTLYGAPGADTEAAERGLKELTQNMEQEMLRIEQSEPQFPELRIKKEIGCHLSDCEDVSRSSEGALDLTIGPVSRLWDFEGGNERVPEEAEIREALKAVGWERTRVTESESDGKEWIWQLSEGQIPDFGAVGKGMVCDEMLRYLEEFNASAPKKGRIEEAVIAVGGSVMTFAPEDEKRAWQIGISEPKDASKLVGTLELSGTAFVATSGDYVRYVEDEQGKRYGHILDPHTGYPAENGGIVSVTVVAENGTLADALSTACFVLGEEKGLELAKRYNAPVLFLDENGGMVMSDEMKVIFSKK